jgi:hypothetical protein
MGAEAVGGLVASAGVVHRDPGGARKPGAQCVAKLGEKVVLAFDQQTEHLALADQDAEAAQRHQSGHCHLPLMVLGEREAAQLRPEVTIDAVRQRRRHRAAIRHLPAALRVPKEHGPAIVPADAAQSIFLVDMTGDGLTDIVRIRNGEVCYWPNLGYGRFGPKVATDGAAVFAPGDDVVTVRRRVSLTESGN